MKILYIFLFFSLLVTTFSSQGDELKLLPKMGTTVNTYDHLCPPLEGQGFNKDWLNICNVVKKSETCKNVTKDKILRCNSKSPLENEIDYTSWEFLRNCGIGVFNSAVDFFEFLYDLTAGVANYTFESEFRTKKNNKIKKLVDSTMAYVSIEIAKEKDKGLSELEAITKVSKDLVSAFMRGLKSKIDHEYYELGCYHPEARSEKLCHAIGTLIVPPYIALKLITKTGPMIKYMGNSIRVFGSQITKKIIRRTRYPLSSKLNKRFIGEEYGHLFGTKVKYLSARELKQYEVFVNKKGLLVDYKGKIIDTRNGQTIKGGVGSGIFVMSPSGRIFLSQRQAVGKFHHSSFLKGKPVAAAGEISVIDGKIIMMNNSSGHYHPSPLSVDQVIIELEKNMPY